METTRLHETGTNSDRYQSETFLMSLHETWMKLKPCSCKYFWPHSEFPLIPSNNVFLVRHINGRFRGILRFHEQNFVLIQVWIGLNSFMSVQRLKCVRAVQADFSNWWQRFIWRAVSSHVVLTLGRSHVMSPYEDWQHFYFPTCSHQSWLRIYVDL